MSKKKYTFEDLAHLFPEPLTERQEAALLDYANNGTIPAADPCVSCEPNLIRKYINRIQRAEESGEFPARRVELKNELVPAPKDAPATEEKSSN